MRVRIVTRNGGDGLIVDIREGNPLTPRSHLAKWVSDSIISALEHDEEILIMRIPEE